MHLEDILEEFEHLKEIHLDHLEKTLKDIITVTLDIPHPAQGQTYQRWQIFARVAATNLTLAKWFESHCDALSILNELQKSSITQSVWAVWAAEGSQNPLQCIDLKNDLQNVQSNLDEDIFMHKICGEKLWCSGASFVDYGLMTFKDAENNSQLCVVNMHHSNIEIDHSHWHAIGMASTKTAKLFFNQVPIKLVGEPNAYLTRTGFWHGAAGVAACWFGATVRIAATLQSLFETKPTSYNKMYFGEVVSQLSITKKLFQSLVHQIDQRPDLSHELEIRILRTHVEKVAKSVIDLVGNAVGARPFCEDRTFAQLAADLPVFLRQSHAAFDLEKIAELTSVTSMTDIDNTIYKDRSLWML